MTPHPRGRVPRLLAALVASALVMAACGGDDDDAGGDSVAADATDAPVATDAPAATTAPTATDAPAATTAPVATDPPASTEPEASAAATEASESSAGSTAGQDCANETLEPLVAAAQEEGQVTVYSSQGQDNLNLLAEAFQAEYEGIGVEIVRDVDSTAIARIETEQQTGSHTADFVVSAAPAWVTEKGGEGWFVEPVGPQFTCETEYDADAYLHENGVFEVSSVVFTPAWNTDAYPDGVEDYPDLLDPALAGGKIGVVDPSIAPVLVDFYAWLDETYGDTYVEDLAAQEPRIYTGAGAIQEALIAGEIIAASYVAPIPALEAAIADGAPVDYAVPETVWGAKFYGTIIDGAPHPNAAQLFANFMVSAQGQELIHSGGAVLPDTPGALATNDQVRNIDLEGQEAGAVSAYVEQWNSLFR